MFGECHGLEKPAGCTHHYTVRKNDHFPIFGSVKFVVKVDLVDSYAWHFRFFLSWFKRQELPGRLALTSNNEGLFER
jgi:hypothetical protein